MNKEEKVLNDLLKTKGVDKEKDSMCWNMMNFWMKEHNQDLIGNPKHLSCMSSKVDEYNFCKTSSSLKLPFSCEMNWGDMYGADLFLRNGEFGYIAADHKKANIVFHIAQENKWNIHADNWISFKLDQIKRYCEDGLPYILVDRDIDMNQPKNAQVKSFVKAFNWYKESFDLVTKRTIILVDVPKLCRYIEKNEEVIYQLVPEHKRNYEINGDNWNGETICCNYNIFPAFEITSTEEKKNGI